MLIKTLQFINDKLVARLFLPPPHPAKPDMAKVLDPLEVRHRHPARVGIHIGNDHRAFLAQDIIRARRNRTIRGLDDQRRLDAGGVLHVDHPLHRRWDQNIAVSFKNNCPFGAMAGIGKALDGVVFLHPLMHRVDIKTRLVVKRAVAFDDPGDQTAIFLMQELGRMIAHIAKPLHHDPLAIKRATHTGRRNILEVAEKLLQGVLHPAPGRLDPALNAPRIDRLAGDAGAIIDIGGVHALVLIGHPGHLALAGAHVRGRHVLRRVDQVALDQLIGKAPGDQLKLVLFPLARINPQPAFGATKRRLDQRAFIGHQRRQSLDLVLIDAHGIADAALDRLHMFGMHAAIAGKGMDLPAQAHPETHRIGGVADANFLFKPGWQIHQRNRAVEHEIHAFAKTWLFDSGHYPLPYAPPGRLR